MSWSGQGVLAEKMGLELGISVRLPFTVIS